MQECARTTKTHTLTQKSEENRTMWSKRTEWSSGQMKPPALPNATYLLLSQCKQPKPNTRKQMGLSVFGVLLGTDQRGARPGPRQPDRQ